MDVLEGDRQFTASVVVISTEHIPRVLLVHHKKFNVWMQPGGHIERDEAPYQAAVREVFEETGLNIEEHLQPGERIDDYAFLLPSPRWVMEQKIPPHGGQPLHYHLDNLFVVKIPWQEPVVAEQESHGIGWFTLEETKSLDMFENTRFLVRSVLQND
jgi:8-oxo-dGTP pyrophosphatase MutT (NUDIX family)